MLKKIPPCQFYKILNKIELIDIDKDIIKRAKKGLIGVLDNDFEEVKQTCDIDLKNYLKPLKKDRTFFLNGEPQIASTWIEEEAKFIEQDIKPYRISKHLMRGLKFRTSDIRDDLAQISPPKKGVKRIFDFSNSWYFMKPEAHVKLASKLSEKMNINDIMIIGSTELEHNVAWLLTAFGFKAVENLSGVFKKCKNIPPIEMKNIKKIITNLYIKAY
jgi:chemotaxis methyl-accepting protein methylase